MHNQATRNRFMHIAERAYIVYATVAVGMFLTGAVIYYLNLHHVCTARTLQCGRWYVTPADAADLARNGISLNTYAVIRAGFRVLLALVPLTLSLLIFIRRRQQPIALFISAFLVGLSITGKPTAVLADTYPVFDWPVRLTDYFWIVALAMFFGIFPNGRIVPRIYWVVILFFCGTYLLNGTLNVIALDSPLGQTLAWLQWLTVLFGGTAAQVYRYLRVSTAEERRQTKWVLFGIASMALWLLGILSFSAVTGIGLIDPTETVLPRLAGLIVGNIMFLFIPVAIGIAILRSQLFDIDVIIRRTLVYGTLTALLALIYFGSIIILQRIVQAITGSTSQLAVVVSTLMIAALFQPLRRRIQNVIDRRFYRRRYNSQKTLQVFGARLRNETDLGQLTDDMLHVVEETLQPVHVSLWLRPSVSSVVPIVKMEER